MTNFEKKKNTIFSITAIQNVLEFKKIFISEVS